MATVGDTTVIVKKQQQITKQQHTMSVIDERKKQRLPSRYVPQNEYMVSKGKQAGTGHATERSFRRKHRYLTICIQYALRTH